METSDPRWGTSERYDGRDGAGAGVGVAVVAAGGALGDGRGYCPWFLAANGPGRRGVGEGVAEGADEGAEGMSR